MPADNRPIEAKIADAINNVVTLTIKTSVSPEDTKPEIKMETTIDLVQGDITNRIDPEFITGDLKELRAFHESQVLKGQQIIRDNIETLKTLWNLIRNRAGDGKS